MSDPIRVLYVLNTADLYGASRSLCRLCAALDRDKYEPIVLVPEDGPLLPLLRAAGVREIVQKPVSVTTRDVFKSWRILLFILKLPLNSWRLRSVVRGHRIDLVHTNVGTIPSAPLGARLAGVPHVWHIRDWYGEFRSLWRLYCPFIIGCSTRVLCVSRAIADQFPANPKITVVHDTVPMEEFTVELPMLRAQFRKQFGIDPEAFVVGCIGRIKFVRKGQEFLVRAVAILRDQDVALTAIIVGAAAPGSEDHLPRLQALAEELGVADRIIFPGELADTRPAFAALDVFALTSAQPEPFGGVVMEAMAMGKPVVATALGGVLDQVIDGQTGFLVPPADPAALAEKIRTLAGDPVLRQRMGAAGAERCRTAFSISHMMNQIEAIYAEALGR